MENGQLTDPAHWAVADVVNYFKATGFEEQANAFQDQVRIHFTFLSSQLFAAKFHDTISLSINKLSAYNLILRICLCNLIGKLQLLKKIF